METTHYPVTEARNKLSSLINRAVKDGERIVLDLHGLPAVVLVPVGAEHVMMDAFLAQLDAAVATALQLEALPFDADGDVLT